MLHATPAVTPSAADPKSFLADSYQLSAEIPKGEIRFFFVSRSVHDMADRETYLKICNYLSLWNFQLTFIKGAGKEPVSAIIRTECLIETLDGGERLGLRDY